MVFWSGVGWVVPVVSGVFVTVTEYSVNAAFRDPYYFTAHSWPKFLAVFMAAALVWQIGHRLNDHAGKPALDRVTKLECDLRNHHAFMFVRIQYWAPVLLILLAIGELTVL